MRSSALLFRVGSLLIASAFIMSCTSRAVSVDDTSAPSIEGDMGYLVIGIDDSSAFQSMLLLGESRVRITSASLLEGSNYIVYPVPAGDYVFNSFQPRPRFVIQLDKENWQVTVAPNEITYVGHVKLSVLGLFMASHATLSNRSAETLRFLEKNYPNLLRNHRLSYGGPGEDPFLSYASGQMFERETINASTSTTGGLSQ